MDIKEFKIIYGELAKKHSLPSFKELNEDFEIEKIDKESDCLIRAIRKSIFDKIANSMNFVEMLLNPVNLPRMYFNYIKSMSVEDRKELEKIYSSLSELALSSLALEIDYNERKEAELVKRAFNEWNLLKKGFLMILSNAKKPALDVKREKSYFG